MASDLVGGTRFELVTSSVSECCHFAEDSEFATVTWGLLVHGSTTWPPLTWGFLGVLGPL